MTEAHQDSGRFHQEAPTGNPPESSTMSMWRHTAEAATPGPAHYPPLREEIATEVLIVGGGITGMTAGLLLQQSGTDVAVLDAHDIGYGVSGFNSGHLTGMLLDMKFKPILEAFGEEAVRTVTLALRESIDTIERLARDNRIECDFKRVAGYLYTESTSQLNALREQYEGAARAGLQVNRTYRVPLPFGVEEAVHVPNQARFHPLRYVQGLARSIRQAGGRIHGNSRVTHLDARNGRAIAKTAEGRVTADTVILATHTPIGFRPAIQTRIEPYRSYIIGFRSREELEDALYWDMAEPYHYLRPAWDERGPLIILGGEDHRTGEKEDPGQCFRKLENYARERFSIQSTDYRWSAQLYNPADGLPYIGKISGSYVATGYSGEGLTFGTLAAQIITDDIRGIQNPCASILSPRRSKPIASAGGFLSENINTLRHFVGDRVRPSRPKSSQGIPPGEGAVCDVDEGKAAIYHAEDGILYGMSAVCTHMGCLVHWNAVEKSWDCPCHGGRYDALGKVLNGPPVADLEPMDIDEI